MPNPACAPRGELVTTLRDQGIRVVSIREFVRNPHPWRDVLALWRLFRIMRNERFDLVHAHGTKAGLLGRLAARIPRAGRAVHRRRVGVDGGSLPICHISVSYSQPMKKSCLSHPAAPERWPRRSGRSSPIRLWHAGSAVRRSVGSRPTPGNGLSTSCWRAWRRAHARIRHRAPNSRPVVCPRRRRTDPAATV